MIKSIKQKLHDFIENADDELLLNRIYEFLLERKNTSANGDLWNKLSTEQQQDLLLSLEESNDSNNLISNEEIKRLYI
jgi:hypothetical protein